VDQVLSKRTKDGSQAKRRGRKPQQEDVYITKSLETIEKLEARLVTEKDTLNKKERKMLRSQASALRSRVNRKLEHRSHTSKLDEVLINFDTIAKIIAEEMDSDSRKRITDRLARTAPNRVKNIRRNSKPEFVLRMKEFIAPKKPEQ